MNSLKADEEIPLLNFEEGPGIPPLNFEGGPGVPLLNFEGGSWVPDPEVSNSGVLVPLLYHAKNSRVIICSRSLQIS